MKNLFRICFLFLSLIANTTVSAFAINPTPCQVAATSNYITLPAGTTVYVEVNETISSEKKKIGNTVAFSVRNNVVVHGKIVISAGSTAYGKIKAVSNPCSCNACSGEASSITIVVENVQAVDGTMVYLNATSHTASDDCMQGAATIDIGTTITAKVRDNNQIYP